MTSFQCAHHTHFPTKCVTHVSERVFTISPVYTPNAGDTGERLKFEIEQAIGDTLAEIGVNAICPRPTKTFFDGKGGSGRTPGFVMAAERSGASRQP